MNRSGMQGLSLIELMITVAVLSIALGTAQAHFTNIIEARRVSGAADALQTALNFARSESIKQMMPMVVTYSMNATTTWSAGIRDNTACAPNLQDPTHANACSIPNGADRVLKVFGHDQFPGITARSNRPFTRFEPMRATATGTNATVSFSSSMGKEVRVIVGNIGRVRTCSPSGTAKVSGYAPC